MTDHEKRIAEIRADNEHFKKIGESKVFTERIDYLLDALRDNQTLAVDPLRRLVTLYLLKYIYKYDGSGISMMSITSTHIDLDDALRSAQNHMARCEMGCCCVIDDNGLCLFSWVFPGVGIVHEPPIHFDGSYNTTSGLTTMLSLDTEDRKAAE